MQGHWSEGEPGEPKQRLKVSVATGQLFYALLFLLFPCKDEARESN